MEGKKTPPLIRANGAPVTSPLGVGRINQSLSLCVILQLEKNDQLGDELCDKYTPPKEFMLNIIFIVLHNLI